jgi:WXG100 family type VII secretion target
MPELLISPNDLHHAAEEFSKAHKETQALIKRLDGTTSALEDKWSGTSQQMFYKYYEEWVQHIEGFNHLLSIIADEMHAMAERYERID